jgi:hypothetical protein
LPAEDGSPRKFPPKKHVSPDDELILQKVREFRAKGYSNDNILTFLKRGEEFHQPTPMAVLRQEGLWVNPGNLSQTFSHH